MRAPGIYANQTDLFDLVERDAPIVKMAGGFHGQGMRLHFPHDRPLTAALAREDYCGRPKIAQRYVDRPLLLNGAFKFDFRVWMLLARADPPLQQWHRAHRDYPVCRAGDRHQQVEGSDGPCAVVPADHARGQASDEGSQVPDAHHDGREALRSVSRDEAQADRLHM